MSKRLCQLVLAILITGCSGENSPAETAADKEAVAAGVIKEEQVRFFIMEEMQLSFLNLTSTGVGNFNATGTDATGTKYDITIEQKPGNIEYDWTNSEGDTGGNSLDF